MNINYDGTPDELADANTIKMMEAINSLLPAQARKFYEPTEDELRRTFPTGYQGDPEAESVRRPGSD